MNSAPWKVEAISGYQVPVYGQASTLIYTTDSKGKEKSLMQIINAVDMKDYDVILGTPWLQRVNPNIDWHEDMWEYKNDCVGKIIQTISKD